MRGAIERTWGPALAALGVVFFTSAGLALMPPHTTGTDPKDGGELRGRTVVFHGFSLDYADKKAEVRDLRTRRVVPSVVAVSCRWEGKGDCPGCQQQRCEARVTLAAVQAGQRYSVAYLDAKITVVAVHSEVESPGPTRPKPSEPRPSEPKAADPRQPSEDRPGAKGNRPGAEPDRPGAKRDRPTPKPTPRPNAR